MISWSSPTSDLHFIRTSFNFLKRFTLFIIILISSLPPHDFFISIYMSLPNLFTLLLFPFFLLFLFFLSNDRQRLGHDGLYNSTHPPPEFLPGTVIPYEIYRKYRTLLEEKRNLKRELKQYDEDFSRSNGRLPKKSDKEVRTRTCTCSFFFFFECYVC